MSDFGPKPGGPTHPAPTHPVSPPPAPPPPSPAPAPISGTREAAPTATALAGAGQPPAGPSSVVLARRGFTLPQPNPLTFVGKRRPESLADAAPFAEADPRNRNESPVRQPVPPGVTGGSVGRADD